MSLERKTWVNGSGGGTPLDATGLNDLEDRIDAAVSGGSGAGLGYVDVTKAPYNAKCDARVFADAAITSGAAILTSASAAFTSADVGKTVVIVRAGASSGQLVRTVASVTNATTVVLSGNAAATVTGATAAIGTDDTAAYQSAINAVSAIGSGTIYVPGLSILAGAQQTGTVGGYTYSGQLVIPAQNDKAATGQIRLLGPVALQQSYWGAIANDDFEPVSAGTAGWISTATSGNVLDVVPASTPFGNGDDIRFSNVVATIENLVVRVPANPQCGGLKLRKAIGARVIGCSVGQFVRTNQLVSALTGPSDATGVSLSENYNNGTALFRDSEVYGFQAGLMHSEHALIENVAITSCRWGITPDLGNIPAVYQRIKGMSCGHMIHAIGSCHIIGNFAHELNGNIPGGFQYDVYDDANYLKGTLGYTLFNTGPKASVYGAGLLSLRPLDPEGPSSGMPIGTAASFASGGNDTVASMHQMDSGQLWFRALQPWRELSGKATVDYSAGENRQAICAPTAGKVRTVQADIKTSAATGRTYAGLVLRNRDSGPAFSIVAILAHTTTDSGHVTLEKYNGSSGTSTNLASAVATINAATTYTLKATIDAGGLITVYINGASALTHQLSGGDITLTDSWLLAGLFTFQWADGDDGTTEFRNFSVT